MLESIFCGCWFIIIDETGKTAESESAKAESAEAESLPEVQPETQSKSSYSYDENSRPVTVKTENEAPADYAQNISALREVYTSVNYNNKNQISSCSVGYTTQNYNYDSMGRLLSTSLLDNSGVTILPEGYTYRVQQDGKASSQVASHAVLGRNYSYTYDNNGNILTVSKNEDIAKDWIKFKGRGKKCNEPNYSLHCEYVPLYDSIRSVYRVISSDCHSRI